MKIVCVHPRKDQYSETQTVAYCKSLGTELHIYLENSAYDLALVFVFTVLYVCVREKS